MLGSVRASTSAAWYDSYRYERSDENLAELLDQMTVDSDRATVLHKKYEASYGTISIYAITEKSGTLSVTKSDGKIMQFNRKGIGTTIIAWGEDVSEDSFQGGQTCEYQLRTACSSVCSDGEYLHDVHPEANVVSDTLIVNI